MSFSCSIVIYLFGSCSRSINSVGEERANISATQVIMWFLLGDVFYSSWYLGYAVLFYCGTPWVFHIIMLQL